MTPAASDEAAGEADDRAGDAAADVLGSPPTAAAWAGLPPDLVRDVVVHARRALQDVADEDVTASVRRLRAIPATKLRRGGGRRQLEAELAAGGPLWMALRPRLAADEDLAGRLARHLGGEAGAVDGRRVAQLQAAVEAGHAARDQALAQRDDARAELARVREERDRVQRAHDGAAGREAGLREQIAALEGSLAEARRRVRELRDRLAAADDEVAAAVARERRRSTADRRDVEAELAAARRDLDEARRTIASQARQLEARTRADDATVPGATAAPGDDVLADDPTRVRPGRPSRLPAGLRLDTREGAVALLAAGRRLLVDGYNVSRTHRPDLALDRQRQWLVDGLAGLAARYGLDVTVVFDAHEAAGAGPGAAAVRPRRGVTVQFSLPTTTADDELVFAVAALPPDEPVIVATDDRELRQRLARHGADLLYGRVLARLL